MALPHACPSRDDLQRMILNRLPDESARHIERHLENCAECRHALEQCIASDELLESVRAIRGTSVDPTKTIYLPVDWLRGAVLTWIRARDTTQFEKDALPLSSEDVKRLLDPPQAPGEIGRVAHFGVLRVLGVGGMALVFEAVDGHLKRHIALKLIHPAVASKPGGVARFLREAQSAAALKHEHVVTIYQVGMHGTTPFIAMELLQGETLEDRLVRGPLSVDEVLRIGREIAEGLAAAHAKGLLHRDIKPANIWLERTAPVANDLDRDARRSVETSPAKNGKRRPDRVKILDFGCAKVCTDDSGLTHSGLMIGTPAYMAPEQLTGKPVDPRADLFSLGCVLYRMASNRPPFGGDDLLAVVRSLALDEPEALAKLNPQVPQSLSDLVATLLTKQAEARPTSAQFVVDRLTEIEQQRARPRGVDPPTLPSSDTSGKNRSGRRSRFAAVAGLALLFPVVFYLFGAQFVRIVTNKGQIVVEIDDPNIGVTVTENQVVIHDGPGQAEITLAAGEHQLALTLKQPSGTTSFETEKFKLERGGRKIIAVRREVIPLPSNSVAAPAKVTTAPSDPDRTAAAWVLSRGGFVYLRTQPGEHAIKVASDRSLPPGHFELTSVNLAGRPVSDADLTHFRGLTHLIEFALNGADVTDAGVARLQGLPELKNLALSNTRVTDAGLELINTLPKLEWLFLDGTPITDSGLKHLEELKNLAYLDLINTRITDAALLELGRLPKLTTLLLRQTLVTDAGLANVRGIPQLRELDLGRLAISDAGLANLRGLLQLHSLWLSETRVTDAGLSPLADLPHLASLGLDNTAVTENCLVALERFKNLKILRMRGLSRISDSALPKFVHLQSLLRLDIRDCHISANGFASLKAALPNLRIEWSEPNVEAATYVLGAGGTIDVILDASGERRHFKTLEELSTQPFHLAAVQLSGTRSALYQSIMAMKHRGLDGLVSIDLSNTALDDGDVDRLQSPPTVRELNIAGTHVTDKCLASLKNWLGLERLNINGNAVHGSGLMHLQSLPELRELWLGGPKLNEVFLVELPGFKKLERLTLAKSNLSTQAVQTLASLKQLRELDLAETKLNPKQLADLMKALPSCRIVTATAKP